MEEVRLLVDCHNLLGEGPLWDVEEQRLYWVDGAAQEIWSCRADGSDIKTWFVPSTIGSMALRTKGGAILALATGFYLYDFRAERFTALGDPEANEPENRLNDGKVDRRGRFFAGYMAYDYDREYIARGRRAQRNAALYRVDPDLSITRVESGIVVSNGPCWSPDDRTFYFSDSADRVMYAYDYNIESGLISNRRTFVAAHDQSGTFDGSTVDAEGGVWNAHVFGGKLHRYLADGTLDRVVRIPTRNVSSVMFGGPNLDVLYVTTMGRPINGVPQRGDHAGGLFAVHGLGLKGVPEPRFAG